MTWWQRSTLYSLFPLSFQDTDGDGYGDLAGILRRLDYMKWLGVGAIWLGPILTTPLIDAGYDIADFEDIDPRFGSIKRFDELLSACHEREMKLVMDLAPNHTSDAHPWFRASRSSRTDAKRDWYIWRDARPDGNPPNNWKDNTGRPAWEWDEVAGQYYYHRFLRCQPDLNYRNPAVQEAVNSVLRFWLDRGVDGFRIDAATHLLEDELLRDEPTPAGGGKVTWSDRTYTDGRAENHRVVNEFRRVLDDYDDRLLFGELTVSVDRLMTYQGAGQFHFPLNNQIMHTEPWEASRVAAAIDQYQMLVPPGEPQTWNLGSHDVSRIATRAGQAQARIAAMLLMTLPGTPIIYYGDEIGLEDVAVAVEQLRDPQAPFGSGRDNYRGAMAWDNEDGAGFTTGAPWLPLPPDYRVRNVETMRSQPTSILHLYRHLLALRNASATLWTGATRQHYLSKDLLTFWRDGTDEQYFIALNFGSDPIVVTWPYRGRVVLTTALEVGREVRGHLDIKSNEGLIVALR